MKKIFAACTLSAIALVALSNGAFAQSSDKVKTEDIAGAKAVVVSQGAGSDDYYRARWAFYNADQHEINRFKAMGFSEQEFKEICNIALESGLTTDYVARQVKEQGQPIAWVAGWDGVSTTVVGKDLPGFGNTQMGIETAENTAPFDTSMASAISSSTSVSASSSMATGNVIDVLSADPTFSMFTAAIKASGLADTLRGAGPYTVFAPTNDAFAKLPSGTSDTWLRPENKDQLVTILMYHIIPGKLKAADVSAMTNPSMATTLGGKSISVHTTAPIMIGSANITRSDIDASNGEIHAIDTVLMPDTTAMSTAAPAAPAPSAPAPATPSTPAPADPSTPAPATPAPAP